MEAWSESRWVIGVIVALEGHLFMSSSTPQPYTLKEYQKDLKSLRAPLSFGYSNMQRLRIYPGSLTVVTAPTGGGKTAFLLNVLLNLLRDHPEETFAFWTYEEPAHLIMAKLQTIAVSRLGSTYAFTDFNRALGQIRSRRGLPKAVRERLEMVESYVQGKKPRLLLLHQHFDSEKLRDGIDQLHEKHKLSGVLLDYVQQVPSSLSQSSGYLGIKAVVNALRAAATSHDLPIIVAAQVAGEDDTLRTREGRDIEMDASLWVHLETPLEAGQPLHDRRLVKVLKHRYGPTASPEQLHFDGKAFAFRELNQPDGEILLTLPSELYLDESMRVGNEHE